MKATLAALAAVDRALEGCVVDVTAGPSGAQELEAALPKTGNHVVIHGDRFGLREMMLAADLAVSGAGVTLCELAATATPTVAIALADNQRPNFDAFARAGAAVPAGGAGDPDLIAGIAAAVRSLADDAVRRRAVGARGRALVDGQGAMRVARAIGRPASRRR